ncbi:plasmid mobilization relaxosome protein MobC [Notoacmeibacter sp. MSK16QG-6]|uniref:plasmid mobilization protein n=1 Tax=Notoacmeibacter sp. MSK16QG-6 TaxID=2957982 RepID=UPI00209DEB26|nr:plasmid mobilization relaxosome protein MobC [Notoacmeibacter sp. MSK16QG-6]MCP1201114.1 plasmid mobilization relaxosome protein MobC [Notoacmeibacter sp. MSK16QG-6]
MADRKEKVVKMRVTPEEYEAISAAAEAADMTLSAFVRSLSLEGAGVRPMLTDEDRAIMKLLAEDMRAIGVNLNQVARHLNAGRTVSAEELSLNLRNVQVAAAASQHELARLAKRAGQRRRGAGR